jgi:hypothetical protein
VFLFFFLILRIEGCLDCCMLLCAMCVIALYFIVLYCIVLSRTILCCPGLHCSTLPPGMQKFAVNNNNNNNKFL